MGRPLVHFVGRQDDVADREAAMPALGVNVAALIVAIVWAVPKRQEAIDRPPRDPPAQRVST